jgi:hypothetical protein
MSHPVPKFRLAASLLVLGALAACVPATPGGIGANPSPTTANSASPGTGPGTSPSPTPAGTPSISAAPPTRTADLAGTLTKLVTSPSGARQALIEAQPNVDGGRKISATLTATTGIFDLRSGGPQRAAASDLKEGQKVQLWLPENSACAQTYPEMCTAGSLAIVADH